MAHSKGPGRSAVRTSGRARPAPATHARRAAPRPGSRPAQARQAPRVPRAAAAGAATSGRRPTPPHLWRLGALVVLLLFLALFLTPTLRGYLDQRAEITRTQQQLETEQARIDELNGQIAQYGNDDFVEQQARERLRFVKPGEVAFAVLDDTGEQLTEPMPGMAAVTNEVHENRPWYGEVWESVKTANAGLPETGTKGSAPAPAGGSGDR